MIDALDALFSWALSVLPLLALILLGCGGGAKKKNSSKQNLTTKLKPRDDDYTWVYLDDQFAPGKTGSLKDSKTSPRKDDPNVSNSSTDLDQSQSKLPGMKSAPVNFKHALKQATQQPGKEKNSKLTDGLEASKLATQGKSTKIPKEDITIKKTEVPPLKEDTRKPEHHKPAKDKEADNIYATVKMGAELSYGLTSKTSRTNEKSVQKVRMLRSDYGKLTTQPGYAGKTKTDVLY